MEHTRKKISEVCEEVEQMLIKKNLSYGDSAINPIRIFATSLPLEQINVRIDDKLNRIMNRRGYKGDDDELDLIGYLILKQVARRLQSADKNPEGLSETKKEQCTCGRTNKLSEGFRKPDYLTPKRKGVCKCSERTEQGVDTKDNERYVTSGRPISSCVDSGKGNTNCSSNRLNYRQSV